MTVGLDLRETTLVVFGNPAVGTGVMDAAPLAALDLPLKVLVWSDGDGVTQVSYTDPAVLAARYGLGADVVAPLEGVHALTDGSSGRSRGPPREPATATRPPVAGRISVESATGEAYSISKYPAAPGTRSAAAAASMSTPGSPGKERVVVAEGNPSGAEQLHLLEHELGRGTLERLPVDVGPAPEREEGHVGTQPVEDAAPVARAAAHQDGAPSRRQQIGELAPVVLGAHLVHRDDAGPAGGGTAPMTPKRPRTAAARSCRAHAEVAQAGECGVRLAVGKEARVQCRQHPHPCRRAAVHRLAARHDQQLLVRHPEGPQAAADSGDDTTVAPVRNATTSAP